MSLTDLGKWPLLQNKIKRDPSGYTEEFERAVLHFRSALDLLRLKPSSDDKELPALLSFISNVAPCYADRDDVKVLAAEIMGLLDAHAEALTPGIRLSFVNALILLRNRGLLAPVAVLSLLFRLFRCRDRGLRRYLHDHIVGDIKNLNAKRKNEQLNRALQNLMYSMVADDNAAAARHSLDVMVELHRKQVWNDAKTVNVIATAALGKSGHMVAVALRFLLGRDQDTVEEDSDDEDAAGPSHSAEVRQERQRALIEAKKLAGNSQTGRKTKKHRKLERLQRQAKSMGGGLRTTPAQFAPVTLINDPQGFAERLFAALRASTAKFELRLLMMATVSQLVASHELLLLQYYPWLQKYVQPHQAHVSQILACAAQACHELVPPDALEPLVRTIVNHFVSDRSRPEVIAIGLNTLREICRRVPAVMDEALLHDLVQYKKDRDKNVVSAARSLIAVFRERNPGLLHRRDRGKESTQRMLACGEDMPKPAGYGAAKVAAGVAGVDLLQSRSGKGSGPAGGGHGDGGAHAEDDILDDEDDGLDSDIDDDDIDSALASEVSGEDGEEGGEDEEVEGFDGSGHEEDLEDDAPGEIEGREDEGEDEERSADDEDDDHVEDVEEGYEEDDYPDGDIDCERTISQQRKPTEPGTDAARGADGVRSAANGSTSHGDDKLFQSKRLDVSRILTDDDFARLRRLREVHAKQQLQRGRKRSRGEADSEDELEKQAVATAAALAREMQVRDDAINPLELEGMQAKKRASKQERLASVLEGREERGKFGHKRKKPYTVGLTNSEKRRKKNFAMDRHARSVRSKSRRSEREKQLAAKTKGSRKYKNKRCGRR